MWAESVTVCTTVDSSTKNGTFVPQPNDKEEKMNTCITLYDIEANIASEHYFTAEEGAQGALAKTKPDLGVGNIRLSLLTFCVLTLRNGFTVTGESACVCPEDFNAEIGRKIARQRAIEKIWPLMGYELRSKLSKGE